MTDGYPPKLSWNIEGWNAYTLQYEGLVVGRAWEPKENDRRRKPRGAWRAGNEELGIPDSGVQGASSVEAAKTACHFWVIQKGNLPPGPSPAASSL
jgi:hypothetical protein